MERKLAKGLSTILIVTACYDEPNRTMGSVPKIARQLSQHARVVVFSGGSSTRVENRSKNLRVYFFKEWLIPDPVNNGFVPRMWKHLDKVLAKEKPDAVLNVKYMFYPNLSVFSLRRKGYRVVTATDTFPGYNWFSASWYVNIVLWLFTRTIGLAVLRRSSKVVLFHQGLVSSAKKLKLNYTVIPNGVELGLLDSVAKKKLAGKLNVVYVGRLESVKGYETICAAMQRLTSSHKDVHFYHIGDSAGKEAFVSRYENAHMHFEGRKDLKTTYSYLKGADIVLLASKSEGLPNAVMEGMAAGCVAVSTPVGAVPALLENGKLGRMFDYNDVDALVKQVEWLLSHPVERKRMAKLGSEKIRREHDWNKLAKQYYDELMR